jgi:predicted amidohydrolase
MSAASLRFAALQLQSDADVAGNLGRVGIWLEKAAQAGAEAVLLPENFAYFGNEVEKAQLAESLTGSGPIASRLAELARGLGVYVIAGGMPEASADPARPYNSSVVWAPDGRVVSVYRKLHLFDVELPDGMAYRESAGTSAGHSTELALVRAVPVGLSICYDLRFPGLYQALAQRGAKVLTVPAAFTEQTGKDHWHVLLRARAIETQTWVVAAAQVGQHPGGRRTYGHSMIVDPWGVVVAECPNREGFVLAELDLGWVDQIRARLPCGRHGKPSY